jgi:uridine phosphorylase
METFHLFHLASCWNATPTSQKAHPSPLTTTTPVKPDILHPSSVHPLAPNLASSLTPRSQKSVIKAAAVHLVFASRTSQEFITPEQVLDLEAWAGRQVLTVLCEFPIDENVCLPCTASFARTTLITVIRSTGTSSRGAERMEK